MIEVSNGKLTLAGEFSVVAGFLDAANAESDTVRFRAIKTIRDEAPHGGLDEKLAASRSDTLALLLKYLGCNYCKRFDAKRRRQPKPRRRQKTPENKAAFDTARRRVTAQGPHSAPPLRAAETSAHCARHAAR